MAEIQSSPPPSSAPAPPPAPGPGPSGPSSGSNTGAVMNASTGINATKGAGGAGGGGGGGGASSNNGNGETLTESDDDTRGLDRIGISATEFALGKMTLQAALSRQLRKNGEVMAPTASDLSALKKALREYGGGGGARVDHFQATEATLERVSEFDGAMHANLDFEKQLGLNDLSFDEFDAHLFDELDSSLNGGIVRLRNNDRLTPANAVDHVVISREFQPQSSEEQSHLGELLADPRAGFAPEGLAAWDLERSQGMTLKPVMTGRSDYSDAESGTLWSIVPLTASDETFVDLARGAKDADTGKTHLLVDANALEPTPRLGNAIRIVSTSHPKVRLHLSMNVQQG